MLNDRYIRYSYNDVTIVPEVVSTINHRSECNPYIKTHQMSDMLPIFAAPMTNVIDTKNAKNYLYNHIIPIIPRAHKMEERIEFANKGYWIAVSLQEFNDYYCSERTKTIPQFSKHYVLIDVANGHMAQILNLVKVAKRNYGTSLVVMAGNVANPKTYEHYYKAGIDYIRCSVGTGCGCITSSNAAIHYPIASLIDEMARIKESLARKIKDRAQRERLPKIVADGGIRNYSDVIKALALGADFVMIGSVFAKAIDSSATKYFFKDGGFGPKKFWLDEFAQGKGNVDAKYGENMNGDFGWILTWNDEFDKTKRLFTGPMYAEFYGMASRLGQIDLQGSKTKTSEGTEKTLEVTYNLKTWSENMADYLRSAMSYTNSRMIEDLKESYVILISNNTRDSINK